MNKAGWGEGQDTRVEEMTNHGPLFHPKGFQGTLMHQGKCGQSKLNSNANYQEPKLNSRISQVTNAEFR
jgi:hypothetical protein